VQYAVGQGFFHAGYIALGDVSRDRVRLLYVYDCGAMTKYQKARDQEIAHFQHQTANRKLDLLFISHAHYDHVSGLEKLLGSETDDRVDTVVLPMMSELERLIAFARSLNDGAGTPTQFYAEFIVDPVEALSRRFGPRQIILLRRAGGSAPEGPGDPDAPNGPSWPRVDEPAADARPAPIGMKLVGRGVASRVAGPQIAATSTGSGGKTHVFEMDDTIGLAASISSHRIWLLSAYVDPAIISGKVAFQNALQWSLNLTSAAALKTVLASREGRLRLVLKERKALVAAYSALASNLNLTSLCLYSGPLDSHQDDFWHLHASQLCFWAPSPRVAWLGTGDADLQTKKRLDQFLAFYRPLLGRVATLALPHHGSDHNFHPSLVTKISPRLAVASADAFAKWRHPGSLVVQNVASSGAAFQLATSAEATRVIESVSLAE
jgi:hypothetical protein